MSIASRPTAANAAFSPEKVDGYNATPQANTAASPVANAAQRPVAAYNCNSPQDVFSVATALTMLFAQELNKIQMATLINLVALVLAGLSAIVTQHQICEGDEIQAPI